MQPGSVSNIPHFLTSSTPSGLMRVMRRNNSKHGKEFNYSTPMFFNGKWFTWFTNKIDDSAELNKSLGKGDS